MDTEATAGEAELSRKRKSRRDRGYTVASIAILAILWALAIAHVFRLAQELQYKNFPCDFCSYYSSDLALRAGLDPYTADLPAIERRLDTSSRILHATEPPTQLLLFEPFTYFSLRAGFWVWIALGALALAASLALLLGPRSGLNWQIAWMLAALAILYSPAAVPFISSQNKLFTLLILVLMMRCMEDGYNGIAGLLLAFAGLTRMFPFVLAGYLTDSPSLAGDALRCGRYAVVRRDLIAFIGAANSLSFLHSAVATSSGTGTSDDNASPVTLVSRIFWHAGYSGTAFDSMRTIAIVTSVVLMLTVTTLVTLKQRDAQDRDWRAFSLWIITSVMLFPSAKRYYLVMLLIPFAALAAAAGTDGPVAAQSRWRPRRICWSAIQRYKRALLRSARTSRASPQSFERAFPLLAAYISIYWLVTDEPRDCRGEFERARSG